MCCACSPQGLVWLIVSHQLIHLGCFGQIPDDDDTPPQTIKEDDGLGKQQAHGGSDDSPDASPQFLSPSQLGQSHNGSSSDRLQPPVILHTLKAEVVHDVSARAYFLTIVERWNQVS